MCLLQSSARCRAYVAGRVSCGARQNALKEYVNALVKIHEVPLWYAVGSADNHRRRITEEIISLNVLMC